jgi:magnesium transporter
LQLKELLEKLLDDDSDMKDINLSAKEAEREELQNRHALRSSSAAATPFDVPLRSGYPDVSGAASCSASPNARMAPPLHTRSAARPPARPPPPPRPHPPLPRLALPARCQMHEIASPLTAKSAASSASSTSLEDDEDVAAVEMLLEPYFMQVDNTWNKLQTLTEYIDDTEDFINIELDSHRNQLIRLDLVLTTFAASVGLITAITGLFAMNTQLYPGNVDKAPFSFFVAIATTATTLAVVMLIGVMGYCRWKRLL